MNRTEQEIDPESTVLGLWDGHDAGAALVSAGKVLYAVNEERLSRRKLDIGFPFRSIQSVLDFTRLEAADIRYVSISTSDFAKTLTRCLPSLGEEYYQLRRRKKKPGFFNNFKKMAKYRLTELPPFALSKAVSNYLIGKKLKKIGLGNAKLSIVDHHLAHAAGAALCSGFSEALVLTLDGIGDGLSGSIWNYQKGDLKQVAKISGRTSLGIFFEHVTNLLNMRELEDEGKVMALADFAHPVSDQDNPLLDYFSVEGLQLKAKYSSSALYRALAKVLWGVPSEQFAYMAQRAVEVKVLELVENALRLTKQSNIAFCGGLASNIKVNMLLRELKGVTGLYIFPHMGDGGLAAGAAIWQSALLRTPTQSRLEDVFLGPDYSREEIEQSFTTDSAYHVERLDHAAKRAAEIISRGEIVMWFQGRMEFGPRALGARSILALPNSLKIKDALNLKLKRRVWYQPFCPTLLEDDAAALLVDYAGPANQLMTCGYRVREDKQHLVQGVINVDGTCRPQILPREQSGVLIDLLNEVKSLTGSGVILNTSFNLHGDPMVMTPLDALETFIKTDVRYLLIGEFLLSKNALAND